MKFKNIFRRIPKTPDEKSKIKKQLLLGLSSGIMLGLSYPPLPLNFLMFFAFVPYFFVLEKRNGLGEINRFTYFTAFIFNIITIYWVGSWTPDADPFLQIAGTVLMFFNPLLFLIPSTLYYFASKIFNKSISLLLFPFFWVSYEYVYSITDFRFPWLTLANSQTHFTTFIQIADSIGAYGITLLIIFINICLYRVINGYLKTKKINVIPASIFSILIIIPLIYGIYRLHNLESSSRKIKVGIVQPNLNPWKKWEKGNLDEQLDMYVDLSSETIEQGAQIVVWPETALPVYLLTSSPSGEVNKIFDFVSKNNVYLLTGMPDATFYPDRKSAPEDAKPAKNSGMVYTSYNSILWFSPNSAKVEKYGKIKLVPFGEKVPYVEKVPFIGDILKWNVGITSWNTGKDTTVFRMAEKDKAGKLVDQVKVCGVICIESIYPDFVAAFVEKGAEMIAVVTNDSWYGNSSGPYQHKEISVLRAVENRRSVIRCANGGISCYINPLGITEISTDMFTKTTLTVNVELENELTFYTNHPLLIPFTASAVSIWIIGLFVITIINKKFSEDKEKGKIENEKDD